MQWTKTCAMIIGLLSVLLVTPSFAQPNARKVSVLPSNKVIGAEVENRQAEDPGNMAPQAKDAPSEAATLGAVIQNVDQNSKLLMFRTNNHEIIELQAPAGMLQELEAGDRVEVVIRKRELTTPSTSGQPAR